MKALGYTYHYDLPEWPVTPCWPIARLPADPFDGMAPNRRLTVVYDNGQLCTFRRLEGAEK